MTDQAKRFAKLSPAKQKLLQAMLAKKAEQKAETAVIPTRPTDQPAPLSFSQQRLWFIDQFMPDNIAYNIAASVSLKGNLNLPALQASLDEVITRHESLRTQFLTTDGQPTQQIKPPAPLDLPIIDLQNSANQSEEIQAHIGETAQRPFDLAHDPLLRVRLLQLSPNEHLLLFVAHHIIFDQWSRGLLIREIAILYEANLKGYPPSLPTLTVQYPDFAHWQRNHLAQQTFPKQLDYWQKQLANAPALLELPTDFPRPQTSTLQGALYRFSLPKALVEALDAVGQPVKATRFMTLLAVFKTLLFRYTQQEDILVGSPIANRNHAGLENVIGFFVNTLVLRSPIAPTKPFLHLLTQVRDVTLSAYEHQDLPIEQVLDGLDLNRNLSHPPLFQVLFALQNAPTPAFTLPDLVLESQMIETGAAKLDLTLAFEQQPNGDLGGIVEYSTDLFSLATIERMMTGFKVLATAVSQNPQTPITQLPLLPANNYQQQVKVWNSKTIPLDPTTFLHTRFAQLAQKQPDHPAVVDDHETLTYAQLEQKSNQLAHHLLAQGITPESFVGVCLPKTNNVIIAFLAILKAGVVYLPIDPNYPAERIQYMLQDAQVALLLTQDSSITATQTIDPQDPAIQQQPITAPHLPLHPKQLAYTIYTSGSTGQPKGVMVSHTGILNLISAHIRPFDLKQGNQILLFTSLSFDVSVFEMGIALAAGGTLHLTAPENQLPGETLHRLLQQRQITHLALTSSLLALTPEHELPHLKTVLVGGEACPADLVARWATNGRRLFHTYGPTEATVASTLTEAINPTYAPPIGQPLPNTQCYILDPHLNPVPVGVIGELYLGGIGLARGYWQRPSRTAQSFVPNPFATEAGTRLYRTGDLVRYWADGNIEFVGRIDNQIKLHGFRIELGEIEAALLEQNGVDETAVAVHNKQLVAYLVGSPNIELVRQTLQSQLPHYMVPAHFILLEDLPRTPNGKIDRRALPAPDKETRTSQQAYVAPSTPIEKQLAQIWAEVLGLEKVGVHDNFFQLGGDSILSIQITARTTAVGLNLTPKQLFEQQTIAQLAPLLSQTGQTQITLGETEGTLPLTPIQQWFFSQNFPNPHQFNQSVWLQTDQPLDLSAVEKAIETLVQTHDALRLSFNHTDTGWQQAYTPYQPQQRIFHIEGDPTNDLIAHHQTQLNIHTGNLFRLLIFQPSPTPSSASSAFSVVNPIRLLFIIHHLAVDGISWRVLLGDFQLLYEQAIAGQSLQLPPKTTSYKYWAQKQQQHAQHPDCLAHLPYWQQQTNQPAPHIPLDIPNGANTQASAQTVEVVLSAPETQALLQDVPQAYQTQINDILLTALMQTLGQWTGQRHGRIDLEGHGREEIWPDVNLSRTMGWFTTLYPVYLDLRHTLDLGGQIKYVKEQLRQIPNKGFDYPILRYGTDQLATTQPATVSFNYFGQIEQGMDGNGRFQLHHHHGETHNTDPQSTRPYLLIFNSDMTQGQLHIRCTFSQNLHRANTIQTVLQNYLFALRQLIQHCQQTQETAYTPSDFGKMDFSQDELDDLLDEFEADWD